MSRLHNIICTILLLSSLSNQAQITSTEQDKIILKSVFEQLSAEQNKEISQLVVLTGKILLETPYVAQTLETEPEQLVINLRELDCTTFAENCLAIARCVKNNQKTFQSFCKELTNIRYRNSQVKDYPSRLHYFSDWIYENETKGIIDRPAHEFNAPQYKLQVDFMSTHPDSYKQLSSKQEFVSALEKKEKEINERSMYYIPKTNLQKLEDKLENGDIVGITTSISGLDISHVGIIVKKGDRTHLMHASSKAKKVIISEETLQDYLINSKNASGIMIARPK